MNLLVEDQIRKKCEEMFSNYKEDAYPIIKEAFSLLIKLLVNIARQPNDEKFRIFKNNGF